ncbi:unnamed protein product [Tilletia caries]|uniref:Uncharacterized protein n=1 Tax=Tilletia caries TaxID=13290 RepID=A0ABN7J255_9BASI|nr:unnamed protein product [Tilletia caries]
MSEGQEGSSADQAAIARALAAAQIRARQAASDVQQQQQQGTLQAYAQARDKDVAHSEAIQAPSSGTSTNPNTSISSTTGSTPAGPSSVSILPATATSSTAGSTPAQASATKRTRQASKTGDATKQPAQKQARVEPQAARTGPTDTQQSSSAASTSQSTSTQTRSSTPPPNPSIKAHIDAFTQFSPNSRSNLIASVANMDKVPGDDTSIESDLEQNQQQGGNPPTLGSSRAEAVGYSKSAILDNFILLPSPAVVTKMTSSQLVLLWHFTKEGTAAGFTKYSSQTDTSKRLLENLGADIPLAKERMDDEQLNYEQFSRATESPTTRSTSSKIWQKPKSTPSLHEEADIWELGYLRCAKDDRAKRRCPMMAKYVALMRHNWYTTPAGERRLDPSKWQDPIWEHVMILKESGAFTEQPSTVMQHQASSSSHAHSSTSHTQQTSSSKQNQPPRQQQQPFPASSSAETRSHRGARLGSRW